MGRKRHVPSQSQNEDPDDFPELRVSSKGRAAANFMPPELDDDTDDENSQNGALTIGDGCFLRQHPSGFGPDM